MTRVVHGSAAEVGRALDRVAPDRCASLAGGGLQLAPQVDTPTVHRLAGSRVREARVRFARWRPSVRVTVEVERWSDDASALTICPTRRPPADEFYAVALAAAEELADAIASDPAMPTPESAGTPMPERWHRAS